MSFDEITTAFVDFHQFADTCMDFKTNILNFESRNFLLVSSVVFKIISTAIGGFICLL